MQAGGFLKRCQVEILQNVQNLSDMNAAGTWRRKANYFVSAISRDERFAQLNLVIIEITFGEKASVLLHPRCRSPGKWAPVKPTNSLVGDPSICRRQILLL